MVEQISIRWHSRAGQGAITASTALAEILGDHGKFVQAFGDFGAEKRGAPVVVFNRISSQKIEDVSHPDAINASVLLDSTLVASCEISAGELLAGLKKNGFLVVNSSQKRLKMAVGNARIFSLDASKIALAEIGRDIPNVPILGTLVRILKLAKLGDFKKDLRKYLASHLPAEIVDGNLKAFERGFLEVLEISGDRKSPSKKCRNLLSWQKMPLAATIDACANSRNYSTGNWSRETCEWDAKKCIDCKMCWPVCPHDAIKIKNGKMVGIDESKCVACGLCVAACPAKCLKIVPKKLTEI